MVGKLVDETVGVKVVQLATSSAEKRAVVLVDTLVERKVVR